MSLITVKALTEAQKDSVVRVYEGKFYTIKEIAALFHTSQRTIGRVLAERGFLTPVAQLQAEAAKVMKMMELRGLTFTTLSEILNNVPRPAPAPPTAVSAISVQNYLNNCTKEQLASHFYTSGLVKLAEIAKNINDRNKTHQTESASANDEGKDAHAEHQLAGN